MAIVALALSILLGAWAPTHFFARRHRIVSETTSFVQSWMQLLQNGDSLQAHQWTLAPNVRTEESDLKEHYERESVSRGEFNTFLREPGMRTIVKHREQAIINMVRVDGPFGPANRNLVHIYFEIGAPTLPNPVPVRIGIERRVIGGNVEWRVAQIDRRTARRENDYQPTRSNT